MSKAIHSARTIVAGLAAALLLIVGSGCVHHYHATSGTHGWDANPPAWAPAQGVRHARRDGVVLVFVKEIDAYRVSGRPNHYFHGKRFYRQRGIHWDRAVRIQGPWVAVEPHALPPGLMRRELRHHREQRQANERRHEERERAKLRKLSRRQQRAN